MIPVISAIALNPNPPRRRCKFLFMNLHGFFSKKSPPDCKSSEGATKRDLLNTQTAISTALGGVERRITQGLNAIMSAIKDFSDRVNAKFDVLEPAVDGLVDDIKFLKDTIAQLQNNPGPISPEDQALLDALEARVGTATTRVTALDAETVRPTPPA